MKRMYLSQCKKEELKANKNKNKKNRDLEQWKIRSIYHEIDNGQECISFCWVINSKTIEGKPGI